MSLNVDTDTVLLVDAENPYNSVNRKVILHNLKFTFPIIAIYILNCYATLSRLLRGLFIGEGEILSSDGTIQGDPTAMGA